MNVWKEKENIKEIGVKQMPDEIPINLDYDRYIELTNEILYDINYYKRPKQVNFF